MKDKEEFYRLIGEIDGRETSEYARLIGDFDFGRYILKINRQSQEVESVSPLFLLRVPQSVAAFPPHLFNMPVRRTALEDYLTRQIAAWVTTNMRFDDHGVARRRLAVSTPGQKILPRSSMIVTDEYVEARLLVELPSAHGRIDGPAARDLFFEDFPRLVASTLLACNLPEDAVEQFVDTMEDADQVRQALPTRGLVSFVAEGALLARQDESDFPDYAHATPFAIDEGNRIELTVPHAGALRGLGIPAGITVVVGDPYSGRIELMRAIAAGIYNHVPGDGREMVITQPDAVFVAIDPRRSVQRVDISAFATARVNGRSTDAFSSEHAGAFASQAAGVVEALDVGARALLVDESFSAPSFLSSDARVSGIAGASSNVVSLCERARQMAEDLGISLIVGVWACAAEWMAVADTVLLVTDCRVKAITDEAKKAASAPRKVAPYDFQALTERSRWVVPSSIDPSAGRFDSDVGAISRTQLRFGRSVIDVSGIEQLADEAQLTTVGLVLNYGRSRYLDEDRPLRELLDLIDRDLSTEGLECLSREMRGDLARPRRYEIAAAVNRLRTLRVARQAG